MRTNILIDNAAWFCAVATLGLGCAESVDEPTQEDYDDMAQSVAPLITQDLRADGTLAVSMELAGGDRPWWLAGSTEGDVSGDFGGLRWDVSLGCRDAQGAVQGVCGVSTDEASFNAEIAGDLNIPTYMASLSIAHRWELTGLQSETIHATGATAIAGSSEYMAALRPVSRSLRFDYDANWDVQVPKADPTLARGTIGATLDARHVARGPDADSDLHFLIEVSVTLDGSGSAEVVLDGDVSYELDLRTGNLTRTGA